MRHLGFEIEPDPLPDRARRAVHATRLIAAAGRPLRVVDREVVAWSAGMSGIATTGMAAALRCWTTGSTLRAEIGEHQADMGSESLEVGDDRRIGEEGCQSVPGSTSSRVGGLSLEAGEVSACLPGTLYAGWRC